MTTPITVAITAATIEEADAFGEFIATATRTAGFTNVTTDTAAQVDYTEDQAAVAAMRTLNPDIFSTPVTISTDQYIPPPVIDLDEEAI